MRGVREAKETLCPTGYAVWDRAFFTVRISRLQSADKQRAGEKLARCLQPAASALLPSERRIGFSSRESFYCGFALSSFSLCGALSSACAGASPGAWGASGCSDAPG